MATDGFTTINIGDTVSIGAMGMVVAGSVHSVGYYGPIDGWYIELTMANVPGGYSYWKQGIDGGVLLEVNGKKVNK